MRIRLLFLYVICLSTLIQAQTLVNYDANGVYTGSPVNGVNVDFTSVSWTLTSSTTLAEYDHLCFRKALTTTRTMNGVANTKILQIQDGNTDAIMGIIYLPMMRNGISNLTLTGNTSSGTSVLYIDKYDGGNWIRVDSITMAATFGNYTADLDINSAVQLRIRHKNGTWVNLTKLSAVYTNKYNSNGVYVDTAPAVGTLDVDFTIWTDTWNANDSLREREYLAVVEMETATRTIPAGGSTRALLSKGTATSNTNVDYIYLPKMQYGVGTITVTGFISTTNASLSSPLYVEKFDGTDWVNVGVITLYNSFTEYSANINITTPVQLRLKHAGNTTYYNFTRIKASACLISITGSQTESAIVDPTADVLVTGDGSELSLGGNKTVKNITIDAGAKLNISGTNVLTITGDLNLKADQTKSFSANIGTGSISVGGTINYIKTIDDSKWYFLSFPSDVSFSQVVSTNASLGVLGEDWYMKYYDGDQRATNGTVSTNWKSITNEDLNDNPNMKLNKYQGYIFKLKTGKSAAELSIQLDKTILSNESSNRNIPVTAYSGSTPVTNHGWNLIGQPYLSKFSSINAIGDDTYYVYVSDGISTYSAYPSTSALDIDPMSAYFVQASSILEASGITFELSGRKLIPASVANNLSSELEITLSTSTGSDVTNLIIDDNQDDDYVIGHDLEKWIGTGTDKPQIYTTLKGINYAYNALSANFIRDLLIGFYSKSAGTCTISLRNSLQNSDISELLLTDKTTGISTDLLKSDYTFTAVAGTDNSRFIVTAQRITTEYSPIDSKTNNNISITSNEGGFTIKNIPKNTKVAVFDVVGHLIYDKISTASCLDIPISSKGMYLISVGVWGDNKIKKYMLSL